MADAQTHVRPTEAQLRWAGFHFKSRAVRLRSSLDKFYLQPNRVEDVEGAFSEDGNTTEESSSSEGKKLRTSRPKISRGRRAMLRMSKRKYERRRAEIERRGFAAISIENSNALNDTQNDNTEGDVEAIFAGESFQKRRRKRRQQANSSKDAERVRRFEAAFHSMMKNLEASQQEQPLIETPSRIWKRPAGAENPVIDYSAIKLLGTSNQKIHNPNLRGGNLSMDRGASWLVHMPERMSRSHHYTHGPDGPVYHPSQKYSSPARKKFKDIVTEFQHRPHSPTMQEGDAPAPTMKVSKYFVPADLEESDIDSPDRAAAHSGQQKQSTHDQLNTVIGSIDPELLKEMEQLDPGVTERLRALYLGDDSPQVTAKTITKCIESPKARSNSFVRNFVDSIEKAMRSNQEHLVAADGRLHKAAFASLVNQYLLEAAGHKKQSCGTKLKRGNRVSALVDSIMSKLNGKFDGGNAIGLLDSAGCFDKQAFEALVTRYLSEATGVDDATVLRAEDLESLACMSQSGTGNEDHNSYVHSISHQLAADFTDLVEPFVLTSGRSPIHQISPKIEAIARNFLIENCGMQSDGYDQENPAIVALHRTVSFLRDAAVSAIHSAQNESFYREDLQAIVTSHFIRFFEESMVDPVVGQTTVTGDESDELLLVQNLVFRLQQAAVAGHLLTPKGTLDVPAIATLTKRYLAAASRQAQDQASPLALAQVRRAAGSRRNRGEADDYDAERDLEHSLSENEAANFVARCVKELELRARDHVLAAPDGSVDEVRLGRILRQSFIPEYFNLGDQSSPEYKVGSGEPNHEGTPETASSRLSGSFVGSVSKGLGNFVKRLYHVDDDASSDLKAYSAFRRSRDSQGSREPSQSENASQASFPQRFKSVVGKIRLGSASSREEDDVNEEYRQGSSNNPFLMSLVGAAGNDRSVIDTDGNDSDTGHTGMHPDRIKSLMLSPALLTKRHRQAIRCIANRQWQEVQYLISANPWLAEMSDVNTKQYLLHKLALYGAGETFLVEDGTHETRGEAPEQLNVDMVRLFPSSVHKFDSEGNLPLHMAAASANVPMALLLGDRFPSGATVRNDDGLLPLHLALLASASPHTRSYQNPEIAGEMTQTILGYFPGAVAVTDNEGNLPIHTAATVLRGIVGVDAIYILFDEAERQLKDPKGVRFRNKHKLEDLDNMSINTDPTETQTDSSNTLDDALHCTMVQNDMGLTPLCCAIQSSSRWEVIDALLLGPCGKQSALAADADGNNALHMLLDVRYQDPTSALSVLKVAPETARARNNDGMLPIELACMNSLPFEVIMAIVLVDLPIEIDNKESPKQRPGFGSSWWYVACECDDHYVEIVDEIVAICTVDQVRALAYMENGAGESLISRAAPESKEILQCSLRYLGRFEIKSELPLPASSFPQGVALFDATDFGYTEDSLDGIDVFLKFFPDRDTYDAETTAVRELDFEFSLVEEVFAFDTHELGDEVFEETKRFCLCIEKPQLTLAGVVSGMMKNAYCQKDQETRRRYALKALGVLRVVARSLAHIHSLGFVHGNVSVDNVGKYDSLWKLAGISGLQRIGGSLNTSKLSFSVPPEAISPVERFGISSHQTVFRQDLTVSWTIDSWGFGKLAYDVLVGRPLVNFDETKDILNNHEGLIDILHWNDFNLEEIRGDLTCVSVPETGIDLVVSCLDPEPLNRPTAEAIVNHKVWQELRRSKK